MNNLKKLFSGILVIGCAFAANAQLGTNSNPIIGATGGVVSTILNGGTNNVTGATSNTYSGTIVLPVALHDHFGVSLNYVCWTSATNGNVILNGYKSYDNGNTYETTPSINLTNALPTAVQFAAHATNYVALFDVSVPNATHIQFEAVQNTGAAGYITNVSVTFNLNNTTHWTTPAPR